MEATRGAIAASALAVAVTRAGGGFVLCRGLIISTLGWIDEEEDMAAAGVSFFDDMARIYLVDFHPSIN